MQSDEYLAAHKIMQQLEAENAALKAQVEELQGDVSRLVIERDQLIEQRTMSPAPLPGDYMHGFEDHPEIEVLAVIERYKTDDGVLVAGRTGPLTITPLMPADEPADEPTNKPAKKHHTTK